MGRVARSSQCENVLRGGHYCWSLGPLSTWGPLRNRVESLAGMYCPRWQLGHFSPLSGPFVEGCPCGGWEANEAVGRPWVTKQSHVGDASEVFAGAPDGTIAGIWFYSSSELLEAGTNLRQLQ